MNEPTRPAPRWITLPGDPAPLRRELAERRRRDAPDSEAPPEPPDQP